MQPGHHRSQPLADLLDLAILRIRPHLQEVLAAGFVFFVFAEVSRNFAMAGLTSAVAAAWVPVIIAASLALTVLLYKEDG